MLEDPKIEEEQTHESRPLTPLEKKILFAAGAVVLAAASFMAGRYSVKNSMSAQDPFARTEAAQAQTLAAPSTISSMSLGMIDFTEASPVTIDAVMTLYNLKKCSCGCNMSIAECIVKDPNCPMWKQHVTEVQKALGNGKKPDLSKVGSPAALGFPSNMPSMAPPKASPPGKK